MITKPIPGLEGRYSARSDGAVISHSKRWGPGKSVEQVLSGHKNPDGYIRLSIRAKENVRGQIMAHRLVCEAFHGMSPSHRHQVNHKNGIKSDNRPENLAWTTPGENISHAYSVGLICSRPGSLHPNAKINEEQVRQMRELGRKGVPREQIARRFGVHKSTAQRVLARTAWRHVAEAEQASS